MSETALVSGVAATDAPERDRKLEHIQLALEQRMQLGRNFFDEYRFEHAALPEIDLDAIDTHVIFLGKRLEAPLLISSMTGGTETAGQINRNLAAGAEKAGVAVEVATRACGFDFYLRKPADTNALLALVDDLSTRTRPPNA